MAYGTAGTPSVSTTSTSLRDCASSSIKAEICQESVAKQGHNRTSAQLYGHNNYSAGGGSYAGFKTDNGSLFSSLPGYDPYAEGYSGKSKSSFGSNASMKSNGFDFSKRTGAFGSKYSTSPVDSKSQKPAIYSNIYKSNLESQPTKTSDKLDVGYQSSSLATCSHPNGNFSSFVNRNQGLLIHNSPMSSTSNNGVWNCSDKINPGVIHGEFDASTELTRGPRGQNGNNPPKNPIRSDLYNLGDFQTQYENAKFFVIKSYSEDDIHKCIKYDVWSSTRYGNEKLDSAFHAMDGKMTETGSKCPVFLFFSVNGSGQFVGVSEMVGPVDFNKDMDFWQLDKWNGFFPVKWHVIKDVPSSHLRHIILENNDYKPVTRARDSQEIELKHGVQMLKIFKGYLARTSILDDFNFYENREKSLKNKRNRKQAPHIDQRNHETAAAGSLINLTKNLSLNSHPRQNGGTMNPRKN